MGVFFFKRKRRKRSVFMFLYSLLEVSEKATNVVKWISIGGVIALLALIALIGKLGKTRSNAKEVAFAGICIAMSFTLAVLKAPIFVQTGGSVTLASFVPIMIYAYAFGPTKGFVVGLIHGLLNFIEDPYILSPATFVFDYLLAFMSVGVMGFFGKMPRKEREVLPIVLGAVCVFSLRFISHLLSGMIFFDAFGASSGFPAWASTNSFVYSLIYQCTYIPADALIATMVLVFLAKKGVLDNLTKLMKGRNETSL
jgi:thiamine transporter